MWLQTSQTSPVRRQKNDKKQVGPAIDHLLLDRMSARHFKTSYLKISLVQ